MFTFCPSISRASIAVITLLVLSGCKTEVAQPAAPTAAQVSVAVPARAGAVEGKTENSDAFIWELFTQFTSPVSGQGLRMKNACEDLAHVLVVPSGYFSSSAQAVP
jgi:hypothetical protein